jgi:hypothetical protein
MAHKVPRSTILTVLEAFGLKTVLVDALRAHAPDMAHGCPSSLLPSDKRYDSLTPPDVSSRCEISPMDG